MLKDLAAVAVAQRGWPRSLFVQGGRQELPLALQGGGSEFALLGPKPVTGGPG